MIPIAMFGWIPFVLVLFASLPRKYAAMLAFVLGWLTLPFAVYAFSGIPNYDKITATSYAALLGVLAFDADRILRFRPRWFDLPVLASVLSNSLSSLTNDLGVYDALSNLFSSTMLFGIPYLIGRIYLKTAEDCRMLAIMVFASGLWSILPCLAEIRMSPFIKYYVYGLFVWESTRYGGYRPVVLMTNGLELGMWMTATCMVGYALWAGRSLRTYWGLPAGLLLGVLLVTTILCKSTGALLLLAVGLVTLWAGVRLRTSLLIWVMLLTPNIYAAVRIMDVWDYRGTVALATSAFGGERAQSLEYRFQNEDILIGKAMQRPIFGWGGYGRNFVADEKGKAISVVDGQWIGNLGSKGMFGMVSWNLMMFLPTYMLLRGSPARTWLNPGVAPAAGLAIMVQLYNLDCLSNAMINVVYYLINGGLASSAAAIGANRGRFHLDDEGLEPHQEKVDLARSHAKSAARHEAGGRFQEAMTDHRRAIGAWESVLAATSNGTEARAALAGAYEAFARSPALVDRPEDVERLWSTAVEHRDALLAEAPHDPDRRRLSGLARNDLAWHLVSRLRADTSLYAYALGLARSALELAPDSGVCWNTLATACYRLGDWRGTIDAIERAGRAGYGHPGYDPLLSAMSNQHLGNTEQARRWFEIGDAWWNAHGRGLADLSRLRDEAKNLIYPAPSQAALPAPQSDR